MSEYRVHDPAKGIIGPVSLVTVKDLVAAGVVHDGMWVSRDGGPFLPVRAFEEIAPPPSQTSASEPKPTYSGDLGKNTFFKVFYRFYINRVTGLLALQQGEQRKDVYLQQGQPVYVTSSLAEERLGQYLVRHGVIDEHELEVALNSMHTDDNRLGYTLIRLGLLEPPELFQVLRDQQVSRLIDLCTWESGRYAYFDGQTFDGERVDLQLVALDLLLQAARSLSGQQLAKRLAPFQRMPIELVPETPVSTDELHLTPLERRVANSIDGRRSLVDLLRGLEGDHYRSALVVAYVLWELDAIAFAAR
jgi:hypothetical protein